MKYSFAQRGIDLCSKVKAGDPARRRFGQIRSNYDGFDWISVAFRQKYINVYIRGQNEDAEEVLRSKFGPDIEIGTWRDGFSILVTNESQFEALVRWLKLE